jgi:hydrogenase maturation protein HypF
MVAGESVRVHGLVQGVGFRPTVWRLARDCGLSGEVWNDSDGVRIRIWGSQQARYRFFERLWQEVPSLARIDSMEREPILEAPARRGFHILPSEGGIAHTDVAPDTAICADCRSDISDPGNRRHRHAFTNCIQCGPRLSIVRAIPYDRANTSMDVFAPCPACRSEYDDPLSRRFHAQPIACPDCGPRLWLECDGTRLFGDQAIEEARRKLRKGEVVAIKGIGGFHLAVDAARGEAVEKLRSRKCRQDKPFALMARDIGIIRRHCRVSDAERALLEGRAAPIVLLEAEGQCLSPAIAPHVGTLGFMLPYSPLHFLLLQDLETPIVLTSGNTSDAPPCIDNEDARIRLSGIADAWLMHDRAIVHRVDDSVVRLMDGAPRVLRRARGYAPEPISLPPGFEEAPPILAMGGELKNTFCLSRSGQAILSQHIGDLENADTLADYRHSLTLYRDLFDHTPEVIAVDLHPRYLSTQLGIERSREEGLTIEMVQHHHAHIASCLAENAVSLDAPPVLGIALDGSGLGDDGTLWGGEFLVADYRGYSRAGSLRPVAMIGGARAVREPWRSLYAHIRDSIGWPHFARTYERLAVCRMLQKRPLEALEAMVERGLNSPRGSSCGRLFDAVAAAVGICFDRVSYEGQAASALEACIDADAAAAAGEGYSFDVIEGERLLLGVGPMWSSLFDDLASGIPAKIIAARFHAGLARAIVEMAGRLACETGIRVVALSGGVFQNKRLFEAVCTGLRSRGLAVLGHRRVPMNDGGLALGQAAIAAARAIRGNADAGLRACA